MKKRSKQPVLQKFNVCLSLKLGLIILVLQGCATSKFLGEDQRFYTGAEIRVEGKVKVAGRKRVKRTLKELITPKPNRTFLGMRPGVWLYFLAGDPKKPNGLRNNFKQKFGQRPVLLSEATPDRTAKMMEGELSNNGYFKSTVTHEVLTKNKEGKVIYTVYLQSPYRYGKITRFLFDSLAYPDITNEIREYSLLKANQRYRLERLQAEQSRIEEVLENHGFFYFDDRHLVFEADSTVGKRKIDIEYRFESNMPLKAKRIYRMKTINIFSNYELTSDSLRTNENAVRVQGFNYIDHHHHAGDNHHHFRPGIIERVINLRPDSIYRRIDHEYTLSHLMGLKSFKYVNIKFIEDRADSAALTANIYLTPLLKKSIQMQLQAVSKSNNFVGPGFELTFTNRNLLKGAELFQFKLHSAYEVQISRQQSGALNAFEFGVESGLSVPRFLTPFPIQYNSAKYLPQTQFKVSYDLQQRLQYFRLASLNLGYGYLWRETTMKTHEFFPADITFVRASKTSLEFDKLLAQSPALANSFQNQFILGAHYSFLLNTQLSEDIELKYEPGSVIKSNFYFNGKVDISGNTLRAIQQLDKSESEQYLVMGYPYSQYLKSEIDFRYYLQLSRHDKLAMRLLAGFGYAYGNSETMPYIKQFSAGGSNSVRAFPARSIGPGTYNVRTDTVSTVRRTFFIDQRGDIKLEGNVEYRFDIIKAFKGAVFVDAGNIWLRKEDVKRPGSGFRNETFLSELAVGSGAGVRIDFSFFVLRFDVAFPLRKPYLDPDDRWVIEQVNFGSREWRKQNLILNIAIGYPF